jgi:hypothetical protein
MAGKAPENEIAVPLGRRRQRVNLENPAGKVNFRILQSLA